MGVDTTTLAGIFSLGAAGTLVAGFYGVLVTRNLIRALIGVELLTKAVTLLLVLAGYVANRIALAQSLAITLIVIEVAVIVAAISIVLCVHRRTGSVDAAQLRSVKG